VHVHPPGTGIMHTINLERLATVVTTEQRGGEHWLVPDTLIGTDSHTPMINGIGVLAWGVGGLEAEGVMFGIPLMLKIPEVMGVRLIGALPSGITATDLALTITERLRALSLAGKFVEFFGPGVSTLSAGARAVVANMAPEYGASTGYFPIDNRTLEYLRATGRSSEHIQRVERYARAHQLWFEPDDEPRYSAVVEIDLSQIEMSLAGPHRPQDRLMPRDLGSGTVAIAAITSCTNTSDPRLLIAAGLLASKARTLGLRPPHWVKTSLAPGSPTAERYLQRAGLLQDLEALGFGIVGYGCTTCIGNSGPLTEAMIEALRQPKVAPPVAVLSGNRNFPGRVHAQIEASFLASPPLVIAYALAGNIALDIGRDVIATTADGRDVYLRDLWPTETEIDAAFIPDPADIGIAYEHAEHNAQWEELSAPTTPLFPWNEESTYLRRPPFASCSTESRPGEWIAAPLIVLGDDITTDHISPAGQIPASSDAADYLIARGERANDLNVFASRRGNWEVMLRGLFTNPSVRNLLGPGFPAIWKLAEQYQSQGVPTVVVAGERYGTGSSRDWAAKGLWLLGVRAVLALSFERIHRSNLIGMGILPLRLPVDCTPASMALHAEDRITIDSRPDRLTPGASVPVTIQRRSGSVMRFIARAEIDTRLEIELLEAGGFLPYILSRL
jgi:aconitate hydratase